MYSTKCMGREEGFGFSSSYFIIFICMRSVKIFNKPKILHKGGASHRQQDACLHIFRFDWYTLRARLMRFCLCSRKRIHWHTTH